MMRTLTDGSRSGRSGVHKPALVGAVLVVVVAVGVAGWVLRQPPATEPEVKAGEGQTDKAETADKTDKPAEAEGGSPKESASATSPADPLQPAGRIFRAGWKPTRLSLSPDGKHLATLDAGAPAAGASPGPRLTTWDAGTGKQDYEAYLVNLTERWREVHPQHLRGLRTLRRTPARVSRLFGTAPAGPLPTLLALADHETVDEVKEEARRGKSGPGNLPIVQRYLQQGVLAQIRAIQSPERSAVLSVQSGRFIDQDPPAGDEEPGEKPEVLLGVSLTRYDKVSDSSTQFVFHQSTEAPRDLAFSANGRWLALCAGKQFEVLERHGVADYLSSLVIELPTELRTVALSGDGSRALLSTEDGSLLAWHKDKNAIVEVKGSGGKVTAVALSADGKKVVVAGEDRVLRVYEVDGPQNELAQSEPAPGPLAYLSISADASRVAAATKASGPLVWDVSKAKELKKLKGADQVLALELSGDGQRLAAIDVTSAVLVWKLAP